MSTTRIHGRVVDAQNRPVPGARVALGTGRPDVMLPDVALLTGQDGRFWIDVPVPGEYVVRVHAETGAAEATVMVPHDGEVVLRLPSPSPGARP